MRAVDAGKRPEGTRALPGGRLQKAAVGEDLKANSPGGVSGFRALPDQAKSPPPFARRRGHADGSQKVTHMVYQRCMPRTNVDIDDEARAEVMRRYLLKTKREAINLALRALAAEPFSVDEARRLRGSGWEGDLSELRTSRSA